MGGESRFPEPMWKFLKPKFLIFALFPLIGYLGGEERLVGFKSLKIGLAAREMGMGGSGGSSAEGGFSFFFNPALSAKGNKIFLHFAYTDWLLDTHQNALFFLQPTKIASFGFGVTLFDYGQVELRPDKPEAALGEYSPKDFTFYFNLARFLNKNLAVGFSTRYFYERFYNEEAKGWGLDLGLFYKLKSWQIGLSYLNWADVLKLKRREFYLPAVFRFGISRPWSFKNFSFLPTFDLTYSPYERRWQVFSGGEVNFKEIISFRFGYAGNAPTFGCGIKRGVLQIDYTVLIPREFPNPGHYFALGFQTNY
ncbi:MAG: PorV/PorQ family protein [candidate division WOR-3 bacterium]